MDPDPDPAIFVIDLQDANKKLFFLLFLLVAINLLSAINRMIFLYEDRRIREAQKHVDPEHC